MYDFHTHTFLSDGVLSPIELIRRALVRGYKAIGVTDHVGIGTYLDRYNRVRPHQALGYRTRQGMFQREQPRERPAGQEVVLIPGVNTTPLAAEDSLDLAPLLFK